MAPHSSRSTSQSGNEEQSSYIETTPFFTSSKSRTTVYRFIPNKYINRVLPIALSASVAMAATAATTVYAYAVIICANPEHCEEEQSAYAGSVALATAIANFCAILALGPLQEAAKMNPKAGLFFWLVSRAMSVTVLAIAVFYKSIGIAFTGRIFEGLATDNLLHYNLSAIYISATDKSRFPRLMGTSLALYMVGMSFSPMIAGLFPNFLISFIIALCIFTISILYLAIFVPVSTCKIQSSDSSETENLDDTGLENPSRSNTYSSWFWRRRLLSIHRPLVDLCLERGAILPGVALLLYNTTQAYLFPALMVFTSLNFSFTGRQNGFLISIAAATSAVYLLSIFYALPRLKDWVRGRAGSRSSDGPDQLDGGATETAESTPPKLSSHDFVWALVSMGIQLFVLPCIYFTTAGWQIFPLVALLALGLAAPSFLKSYGVSQALDQSAALASLAMMESMGGLLSAVILGSWQTWKGEGSVFFAASALVAAALLAILASKLVKPRSI